MIEIRENPSDATGQVYAPAPANTDGGLEEFYDLLEPTNTKVISNESLLVMKHRGPRWNRRE